MGNCIEGCKNRPQVEVRPLEEEDSFEEQNPLEADETPIEEALPEEENQLQFEKDNEGKRRRVKIWLTREELEWLMFELRKTQGKNLEDLLGQIVRDREKSVAWRPCLDIITETPDQVMPEGMDR